MPEEEDTEVEKFVYNQIKKHFSSSRVGMSQEVCDLLSSMIRIGWYKPVLHPPPNEVLYRGIKLRGKEDVINLIGINQGDFKERGYIEFEQGKYIQTFNGSSTSWSSKKKVTSDFSRRGKAGYSVTIIAGVEENKDRFLAGPGGLYNVRGLSQWHMERETVGLEPIKIKRIEWNRI